MATRIEKVFIAVEKETVRKKTRIEVYQWKNKEPEYIGYFKININSTKGAKHEALCWLIENKYIPKKYYDSSCTEWRASGYYYGEVTNKYKIYVI